MPMLIVFLFAVGSGAAALLYQISWTKQVSLLTGNTGEAVSLIVAGFMLGLGLGAYAFGRVADRARNAARLYGIVEILIAVLALAFPALLGALGDGYVEFVKARPEGMLPWLARSAAVLALVTVPAFAMGATFPLLCRIGVSLRPGAQTRVIALLYGLNTLGAVIGVCAESFWLMEALGVAGSTRAAAAVNVLIGLASFKLAACATSKQQPELKKAHSSAPALPPHWALGLLFASGFVSLAYEVVWTRMLSFFLKSHLYAFAAVLAVFLAGIALGGLLAGLVARQERHFGWLAAALLIMLGLWGMATLGETVGFTGLHAFQAGLERQTQQPSKMEFVWMLCQVAGRVVFVPTVCMGLLFPVLLSLYAAGAGALGAHVGRGYFVNTVGGVLGSLAAGYGLIPYAGMCNSVAIVAVACLLLGAAALLRAHAHAAVKIATVAVAVVLFLPMTKSFGMDKRMILYSNRFNNPAEPRHTLDLLYYKEGRAFAVSVVRKRRADSRWIFTDRFPAAITDPSSKYMQMLGHVPMLVHPNPQKVLVICLGTGTTCGSVGAHRPARLDIVDISPEVVEAARAHFADVNLGVLEQPFAHVYVQDGRQFVLTTPEKYDVITLEPLLPHTPAAIDFYTRDFYQVAKRALAPGGIVCQWIPIHSQSEESYRILLRSFASCFKHCSLWFYEESSLVLGSDEPFVIDSEKIQSRIAGDVLDNLRAINHQDVHTILSSFVMDEFGIAEYCRGAEIMTDERPMLLFNEYAPAVARYTHDVVQAFLVRKRKIAPLLANRDGMSADELNRWEAHFRAHMLVYRGVQLTNVGKFGEALADCFEPALEHAPGDGMARNLRDKAAYSYNIESGRTLNQQGDHYIAVNYLAEALRLRPKSPEAHYYFALAQINLLDFDSAREHLLQAVVLDDHFYHAWLFLAQVDAHQERWEDAYKHTQAALAMCPGLSPVEREVFQPLFSALMQRGYRLTLPEAR